MAGISSVAMKADYAANKYLFQKKELQSKEFSDGSGLDWYDFGARDYDPQIGRWNTVDSKADKYFSSSPYNFVDNNPVSRIDPTGQDWFYYQAKGEKQAAWHWNKGHSAKYVGSDGESHTTKQGYRYLVTFTYDKGTTFNGGHRGTLTLYDQNKVLKTSSAFSGGGAIDNFKQAGPQNYFMNLGQRGVMSKENKSSSNSNHNPPANSGMQKIEEGTTVTTPDGEKHDVNSDYGNYRIRLNPTSGTDRGLYLHGKNSFWTSRTHGCVCEKDQEVLQYIWDHKEINTKTPFAVGQEKKISDE
jgi:RHS repeat-associated protein